MWTHIERLAKLGNITISDARIVLAFAADHEIQNAVSQACVWELRDECHNRARSLLGS